MDGSHVQASLLSEIDGHVWKVVNIVRLFLNVIRTSR
jgi:hypothetical protein